MARGGGQVSTMGSERAKKTVAKQNPNQPSIAGSAPHVITRPVKGSIGNQFDTVGISGVERIAKLISDMEADFESVKDTISYKDKLAYRQLMGNVLFRVTEYQGAKAALETKHLNVDMKVDYAKTLEHIDNRFFGSVNAREVDRVSNKLKGADAPSDVIEGELIDTIPKDKG